VNAPDWFLEMPVITGGPTILFSVGILWFCRQLWRAIQIEADEAERKRNP